MLRATDASSVQNGVPSAHRMTRAATPRTTSQPAHRRRAVTVPRDMPWVSVAGAWELESEARPPLPQLAGERIEHLRECLCITGGEAARSGGSEKKRPRGGH